MKHNLLLLSWTSCKACRKCRGKSELSEFTLFELKDLLRSLLSLKFKVLETPISLKTGNIINMMASSIINL